MTEPTIVSLADPEACALAAAERIIETLDVAIDDHDEAHWVTTGGSTPAGIYQHLAGPAFRNELDWRKVHLWLTDERFVPPDHALSNGKIAADVLLGSGHVVGEHYGAPIPLDQVHLIETGVAIGEGHDESWCAARYAEDLQADGPDTNDDGWPMFDLILLGIGPDGHILSVFPGSDTFDRRALAQGVPAPTHVEPHVPRITMHPSIVPAAHELLVVCTGKGKAVILRDILRGERDERALPAQLARRPGATWILDHEAARLL
ncbi:MAG TPA: 6-phosphogluconolactonase [Candidatus Limnocylindrales bacterium]|jgi:6-phosphogluconolactonase